MSEQTPPAPPDGGNGTPPPAAPAAPTPFVPTKEEWVESRKEQRQIRELLTKLTGAPAVTNNVAVAPPPTPPPAPAPAPDLAAQIEDMRMDLAIARALGAAKIADTDPLAETLTELVKAKKPPDVAAFITQRAAALRPSGGAPPAPVTPPVAPSNTGPPAGPPAGGGGSQIPENPFHWGPEILKGLQSPGEFHEAVAKWERKNGRGNPLADMRARAEAARKPR